MKTLFIAFILIPVLTWAEGPGSFIGCIEKTRDKYQEYLTAYEREDYQTAFDALLVCRDYFPESRLIMLKTDDVYNTIQYMQRKEINKKSIYYNYYRSKLKIVKYYLRKKDRTKAREICQEVLARFPHNEVFKTKFLYCLGEKEKQLCLTRYFSKALLNQKEGNVTVALKQMEWIIKAEPAFLKAKVKYINLLASLKTDKDENYIITLNRRTNKNEKI
jgi:tetratricopeptide (TPR) repeat protein